MTSLTMSKEHGVTAVKQTKTIAFYGLFLICNIMKVSIEYSAIILIQFI